MARPNKAHTATANRIAKKYGGQCEVQALHDVVCDEFVVEVETTATLETGIEKLKNCEEKSYIAVTNQESLSDALKAVEGTPIGVMDPQGKIIQEADEKS